jgi:oligoribonuclease NrnB/cAMP/cGMP phosphodiesterase (DHH superfamily)
MTDQKLPLCIWHKNCADGFGAAWVFKYHSGQDFDFFPGTYQKPPPDVTGRDVYLVDFSYKRAVVEEMLKTAKSITLIDHHKSAIEDLQPLIDDKRIASLVSIKHSGAMLAWMFWKGIHETPPVLLQHIEDRDLWLFKMPGTREIQTALFSYPYDFEVWDKLMRGPVSGLMADGRALVRKHMKDVAELIPTVTRRMNIGGFNVPVANMPYLFSSDAGHMLAAGYLNEDGHHEPFAACYWDTPTGRTFSLRSTDDGQDVAKIAEQFGGGGHARAAGFSVSYYKALEFEILGQR